MPNKGYQENNYFTRPPCAQQGSQQQYNSYGSYSNSYTPQSYDGYFTNRNQYGAPMNGFESENWLPDPRLVGDVGKFPDKIETIEISSKDLSPASCCSNLDMLLPDFYKNPPNQWFYNTNYNKSYVEFPSCSQQESTGEKSKYCSIQKTTNNYNYDCSQYMQFQKSDCALFAPENSLATLTDVFPQDVIPFDPIDQRTEVSDESDIIVEESDEEEFIGEEIERKFNCIVCNVIYSPIGNQFYFLTSESPLTMSSQKPVYTKLQSLVGKLNENSYLCGQCLGLINTIDHLELKLEGCKVELTSSYQKTNNLKIKIKKEGCRHRFNCKLCRKSFTLQSIHKNHLKRHKLINRFLCEVCGKQFTKLRSFKIHQGAHKSKYVRKIFKIPAYICKICKKPFRTKSNLKDHENYCSGRLPHKCRICNKKFATPTKLKNHVKLKHDQKFTSICSICNIGFVKISDYKTHMISHSTDKRFSCDKCEKSYKTLSNLKFHLKFHDENLPFNCPICSKGFMRKEYLESHMSSHTGKKNYVCSFCEKKFVSQKNLDVHMKNHDGNAKKKSCNVCGKLISKGLEDHLRTHTNLKEFECEKCDLRFNTKNAMLKHVKRKHCLVPENKDFIS